MARVFTIDLSEDELKTLEEATILLNGRALTKAALASSRSKSKRFKNSDSIRETNVTLSDKCKALLGKLSEYV